MPDINVPLCTLGEGATGVLVVGRHREQGDRYPNGKLKPRKSNKPDIEPMSGALFQRLRQNAKRAGIDPRVLTELGRLNWDGELTLAQTAAGLRVAEIYGRFEGYKRKGRTTRSPSYNASYGEAGVDEELLGAQGLAELERRIRDATEAWQDLVGRAASPEGPAIMGKIPAKLRPIVEQLCVEDRHISPVHLDQVRMLLQGLAIIWKISGSNSGAGQQQQSGATNGRHGPPLHFNRHEEVAGAQSESTLRESAPKKPNIDRIFFMEVVGKIAPDKTSDELGALYDIQQALKQRAIFRQSKLR